MCILCIYVSIYHMSAGEHRCKKRALDPSHMWLQEVVNHQIWVLGTILRSFGRAVCTFYYPVIFLAPEINVLKAAVYVDEKEAMEKRSNIVMPSYPWIKLWPDNVLTKRFVHMLLERNTSKELPVYVASGEMWIEKGKIY